MSMMDAFRSIKGKLKAIADDVSRKENPEETSEGIGKVVRNCLVCNYGNTIKEKIDNYSEVTVCPKCNGAFVDLWCINKYIDDSWKPNEKVVADLGNKKLVEAINKMAGKLNECELKGIGEIARESLIQNTLLIISLKDENSAPKVFYKGEEIKFKTNVSFDYETSTAEEMSGGLMYAIEHHESDSGFLVRQRIERHIRDRA